MKRRRQKFIPCFVSLVFCLRRQTHTSHLKSHTSAARQRGFTPTPISLRHRNKVKKHYTSASVGKPNQQTQKEIGVSPALSGRGFTLIELLVVTGVIAMALSIVAVMYSSTQAKSRDADRVQHINQIKNALELYANVHGEYPSGTDLSPLADEGHIPEVPLDPTGVSFWYQALSTNPGGPCSSYHLGTPETYETELPVTNENFNSSSGANLCGAGSGFDGSQDGVFDVTP